MLAAALSRRYYSSLAQTACFRYTAPAPPVCFRPLRSYSAQVSSNIKEFSQKIREGPSLQDFIIQSSPGIVLYNSDNLLMLH